MTLSQEYKLTDVNRRYFNLINHLGNNGHDELAGQLELKFIDLKDEQITKMEKLITEYEETAKRLQHE